MGSFDASDAELMARSAEGDEAAFAQLYDRFSARVYGLARKVVRDPARAEEIAQEVFVEAWRIAPRYDPTRGAVASWLLTLTHRRAVDVVRSDQASRDREDRVGAAPAPSNPDPVGEQIETREEHSRVRAALAGLSDLQREAIELAYFGGRTYREVADAIGSPLGTVKSRMRDGLMQLRETMEGGPA